MFFVKKCQNNLLICLRSLKKVSVSKKLEHEFGKIYFMLKESTTYYIYQQFIFSVCFCHTLPSCPSIWSPSKLLHRIKSRLSASSFDKDIKKPHQHLIRHTEQRLVINSELKTIINELHFVRVSVSVRTVLAHLTRT